MRVMCGDQSPLNGGLIRAALLAKADPSLEIIYCFHDTDAPWLQTGGSVRLVKGGWPEYWALAARIPHSPDIPGLAGSAEWQRLRDSLDVPPGIVYLAGPKTNETIASTNACPIVGERMCDMHRIEGHWAGALNSILGRYCGILGRIPSRLSDVPSAIESRFARDKLDIEVVRSTEFWRDHPVQFHRMVPPAYYWQLDEEHRRYPWSGGVLPRGHYLAPKALVRSIEEAALGIVDCFTGIPYLDKVVELRDEYVPGLPLPHIRMTIQWTLPLDPLVAMEHAYRAKKRRRIAKKREKSPDYEEEILSLPLDEAQAIGEYWHGRPTSIAHEILGGELAATLEHRTL
jgi:hypothetical protein